MKEQQILVNLDKEHFMSNQQTVAHNPDKFIIDFQSVYPQFNLDNQSIVVINHKVILLDTYSAKSFLGVLKENIAKYENKFGEIKKPKQVEQAEKEMKDLQKQEATATERPSYMG